MRKKTEKRVLLVARNSIAADHMLCIYDILRNRISVEIRVATDRFPTREFDRYDASRIIGAESMHIFQALVCHWDLIVFTNHAYGFGRCFPAWTKKLYINHGLHTGKINNNMQQDGVYGRSKVVGPFGKVFYDCMFAASKREKELALNQTPELSKRVKVVGFLRADEFLHYARKMTSGARDRLGYTPAQTVVHIISTWGENSLYATRGQWLIDQVARLSRQYAFVVSIHPRFDSLGKSNPETRDRILTRFEQAGARINVDLDWRDYITVADIAISDHSSLVLYHVLLEHPVIMVDVNEDQYIPGSTFDILKRNLRRLSEYIDLKDALEDVLRDHETQKYHMIVDDMLDHRGTAITQYKKEIERLLDAPGSLS